MKSLEEAKAEFEKDEKEISTKINISTKEFEAKLTAFSTLASSIIEDEKNSQLTRQVARAFSGRFKELLESVLTKQIMHDSERAETIKSFGLQYEVYSRSDILTAFKNAIASAFRFDISVPTKVTP